MNLPTETELKDGEPCSHKGCLNHVSHPCEGCGRIAGRSYKVPTETELKEFCRLAGVYVHEIANENSYEGMFSHPEEVLEVMMKRDDFGGFILHLIRTKLKNHDGRVPPLIRFCRIIIVPYALFWRYFDWLKKGEGI